MKDRIKQVRQCEDIDLSQEAFGKRLGVTGTAISRIESGNRGASDQIVLAICREFHINEIWLRTGQGDMFVETAQEDKILSFMGDVMHGSPDFRRHLLSVLARMTPEEWTLLEKKAWELVEEMKKADPKGPAE
jgi:Predicted transcriptional regulators